MKLVTYEVDSRVKLGVISRDGEWVIPLKPLDIEYKSMLELIREISDSELQLIDYTSVQDPYSAVEAARLSEVEILSPIPEPEQDIICLGKNYIEHAAESAQFKGEQFNADTYVEEPAIYFAKRVNYTTASGGVIPLRSDITNSLDYESELAVIIRKDAYKITPEEVKSHIFGYSIINDVSARDMQVGHKQWFLGKSIDGFAPLGPCILTADSVIYPPELDIKSFVNSELRQSSNTKHFIHSIDSFVSELSSAMILKAGTIIASGTPAGVGMGFLPPKFLQDGDEVICEIEGIGKLINTVRDL